MSVGRDYKNKSKSKKAGRPDRRGVRRLGLVVVVLSLIGLGAGGWHYWRQGGPVATVAATVPGPQPAPEQPAAPARPPAAEQPEAPPKYSFYETLRQREVVIPADAPTPAKPAAPAPKAPAPNAAGNYLVQAGAFRTPEEADQRKAMLALLGIRSRIEAGSNGLHRVRIGPLGDLDEVQNLRRRLQANDIDSYAFEAD